MSLKMFGFGNTKNGIVPRKLYVGGIPYQSTKDEIHSYFEKLRVITKVDHKMRKMGHSVEMLYHFLSEFSMEHCCFF